MRLVAAYTPAVPPGGFALPGRHHFMEFESTDMLHALRITRSNVPIGTQLSYITTSGNNPGDKEVVWNASVGLLPPPRRRLVVLQALFCGNGAGWQTKEILGFPDDPDLVSTFQTNAPPSSRLACIKRGDNGEVLWADVEGYPRPAA